MTGWALLLVVGYAVYAGTLFVMQTRLMFPAGMIPRPGATTVDRLYGVEIEWIGGHTARVETWFLKGQGVSAERPGPLVVLAHGNGELIDDHIERMLTYSTLGVSTLAVEYRGYGRSGGSPGEKGIVDDTQAALERVLARPEVDASRVIYHGRSLGGGVLCSLAARHAPRAMILESTFTSAAGMATRFGLPPFLVTNPFRNDRVVKNFTGPILIFHGSHDEIIPVSHARKLLEMAKHGTLIEQDAGHNDFPADESAYWDAIEGWLREQGGAR